GVILGALHLVLLKTLTNDGSASAARRTFLGWRFAIHGLVVVTTLTALLVVLFQRDGGDRQTRDTLVAILFVWLPLWALHIMLLNRDPRSVHTTEGRNPLLPRGVGLRSTAVRFLSFPGSAWERAVLEAPPPLAFGRQSLAGSAFPGGAWERELGQVV